MAELSGGKEGNKTRTGENTGRNIDRERKWREIEDEKSERKQGWINNQNNPKRKTEKNNEREKRGRRKERRKRITLYKEKIGERE
jgi:hypothetical protein